MTSRPRIHELRRLAARWLWLGMLWAGLLGVAAVAAEAPLTTALSVRSLPPEEAARALPATLHGTVVFVEGPKGAIVLQDGTGGTYFRGLEEKLVEPGDVVTVKGVTSPGKYVPGLEQATYEKVGRGALPPAVPATYADFVSGRYFFQRVVVVGVVHAVRATPDATRSILSLAMGQDVLEVRICVPPQEGRQLVDARVRLEAVASGGVNQRRQLVQPIAWVHDWSWLQMVENAPAEDDVPMVPASVLLAFDVRDQGGHRVRVAGTVLASYPDGQVFLRDGTTALRVHLQKPQSLEVGAKVEVLGFPKMARFSAALISATVVRQAPGPPPSVPEVTLDDLLRGTHDNELITVTATLSGHFREEQGDVLVLEHGGRTVRMEVPQLGRELLTGSRVRVTGICLVESNTSSGVESRPHSVTLRCRGTEDVHVLQEPSRWTTRRLALIAGVLLVAVVLAGLWIASLRRQVRRQTQALRRQIEHEATLEERQRIARDFHDTLEQGLTGLALRLEGVQARGIDEKNGHLLRASRRLISQIQAETRSLVSELREPAPGLADIAAALRSVVEEHPVGCEPEVTLSVTQPLPPLPSRAVHHLRMMVREAVTNALKHAHARQVRLAAILHEDHLKVTIADDGCGFDPSTPRGGQAGHFGCIGIEERCEKIGAKVQWHSSPGQGTRVEIDLPVEPTPATTQPTA